MEIPSLSATRNFDIVARLALWTTVLMFGLMVLGSVVRTTDSGLACPDWPLCEGRIIPRFEFHIMVEWTHRVIALVVSLLLLATTVWTLGHRDTRARLGGLVVLSVCLLFTQIFLGALTVWRLLHPAVVSSHLAVALLLFVTFLTTQRVARTHAESASVARPARPGFLLPLFAVVATLTYGQAILGGAVSTSHAGLACPDWPTCNGVWLPALEGPIGLHAMHRFGGYLMGILVFVAAVAAWRVEDGTTRALAGVAVGLVLVQIALGVLNILMGLPTWAVAAHLGIATALIGTLVTAVHRLSLLPVAHSRRSSAAPEAA